MLWTSLVVVAAAPCVEEGRSDRVLLQVASSLGFLLFRHRVCEFLTPKMHRLPLPLAECGCVFIY